MTPSPQLEKRRVILVAGSVMVDLLVASLPRIPHWDENAFVDKVTTHLGGLAANTAICLARLGAPVRIVSRIGNDPLGEFARHHLEQAGVDCRSLRVDPRLPTSMALGFVGPQGKRFFVVSRGANAALSLRDFTAKGRRDVSHFHLGGFFHLPKLEPELATLLAAFRRRRIWVSLDLAWNPKGSWRKPIEKVLPHLDAIFPNRKQAIRLTGATRVPEAARRLRQYGVGSVLIKLAEKGCYLDTDSWRGYVAPFPVQVVDTTGAGDNFAAAYLDGMRSGWPPVECARFANVVAAASTRAYGASAALPSKAAALRWMHQAYKSRATSHSARD